MILTAEEFLKEDNLLKVFNTSNPFVLDIMIEFAKLHVEEALKVASIKARIIDDPNSYCGNTGSEYPPDSIVSEESILNAYPKELIK